ncbi:MAG: nitroreductase family protein, partial [Victivallaceae bacterium]
NFAYIICRFCISLITPIIEVKMNFMELLLRRESCRSFSDKSVSREDLMKIVEAGRLSPSGCNSQPWKFIVVDEAEPKELLCDAMVTKNNLTGAPWRKQVPAFIMVVEQPAKVMSAVIETYHDSQRFAQGDIGMAALNICYAATELGLSCCMVGLFDQQKLEKYFHIPDSQPVRLIIALGYNATSGAAARPKVRKDLAEVCSFNRW